MPNFELEFPGIYVDDVGLIDTIALSPVFLNRDPEPTEVGVPKDTSISIDIVEPTVGGSIVAATVQVWIDEILAYDGSSGFQAGYNGPGSAASTPNSDTRRIAIDPTFDFNSEQVVTVRVRAESTVSTPTFREEIYSFTIEDLTPPKVLGAEAPALKTVRVTFSEPVLMVSAASASDALNPANYAFTRNTIPSVDAVPVSVTQVDSSTVEIEADIELTPGGAYTVIATNVVDLYGNAIEAPYNSAEFVAFYPPQPDGRRFDLYRMIPQINRDEDVTGDLRMFLEIAREPLLLILSEIDRFADLIDPDFAPEMFVDAMLQDLNNPFDFDLSEIDKRRLAQLIVSMRKQKGTAPGIKNAIRFFMGLEVELYIYAADGMSLGDSELGVDWILAASAGSPALFSFDIIVTRTLSAEEKRRLRKIVNYMKDAREHYKLLIEPAAPIVIDHMELGLSELGITSDLH